MNKRSDAQVIEIFHLLFLQVLTSHSQDWFVLKGGANLRYYFDSVRYSNDIDLDFFRKEGWQVERAVDAALAGKALEVLLSHQDLEIRESTKPKQTETTRRWKLGLAQSSTQGGLIGTKLEFSHRGTTGSDILYETIPNRVVDPYAIRPATMSHYGQIAALEQKIAALALRSETKAAQAAQKAMDVTYSSFRSEVIPFLDPDMTELFDGEDNWNRMREGVSNELSAIAVGHEGEVES